MVVGTWLVGWLVGWLEDWLVDWLVGLRGTTIPACLNVHSNRRSPTTQPSRTRRAVGTTRLNGPFHAPWQQKANQVRGTLSLTSPSSAYKTKTGGSKRKQSTTARSTTRTTKPTRMARPVNPHRDRPRPPELPIQATRRSPRGISKRSKATKTTSPTTASDGRRRRRTHRRPTTNRRQTTGRHTVLRVTNNSRLPEAPLFPSTRRTMISDFSSMVGGGYSRGRGGRKTTSGGTAPR